MRGRRAPELAHGVLFSRLKETIEKQRTQVVFEAFSLSDETQRETVLQEFEIGANVVLLNAELKLNFWQDLPWKLCALAVPDLQEQKKHAKEILRVFGQHPQQKFQHRVTWDILAPGTVTREELDKFAADPDSPLASYPRLCMQVARLAFIPVVERCVEGAHSLVKRYSGYRKVTGAYISLADRFPEIEEVLLNPCGKVKLLNLYQTCRKMRKLARLMRFEAHPVWQAEVAKLQGASRGQGKKRKLCNSIVYSVDPASQYVPLEKPRKLNERLQANAIF